MAFVIIPKVNTIEFPKVVINDILDNYYNMIGENEQGKRYEKQLNVNI